MSIIESFWLFFLPPLSDRHLLVGHAEPWTLLLAVLAAFALVALSFLDRPLQESKESILPFFPLAINAMTLTFALILLPLVSLLSIPTFRYQGFTLTLLFLPSALTFLCCYFSLRHVSFAVNSGVKMVSAALLVELALVLQSVLSLAGVKGVAIVHVDVGFFVLVICFSSLCLIAAFWVRFSPEKHGWWDRDLSRALLSGGLVCLAALIMTLLSREAISLSIQSIPQAKAALYDNQGGYIFILVSVFLVVLGQMANALFRLKTNVHYLEQKSNDIESALQTVSDALIAIDKEGKVTFFNHAAEKMFGWYASEIVGQHVNVLIADEYKERHDVDINHFLGRQGSPKIELITEIIVKRKEGTTLPVRLALGHRHLHSQSNHEFVALLCDISEQRHVARALKENAKQYRSLIANLPCMAFREMTGAMSHIVYISDVAKSMTGFSASVLTGQNGDAHFIDKIAPCDLANYRKVRERAARRNEKYDCEYSFFTKNQEEKRFWEIGHSYRAADGNTWIDGVIIDITDKQEAEKEDARSAYMPKGIGVGR